MTVADLIKKLNDAVQNGDVDLCDTIHIDSLGHNGGGELVELDPERSYETSMNQMDLITGPGFIIAVANK